MPALLEYLKQLNGGKPLGKLALLTESDTEFGHWPYTHFRGTAGSHTPVTLMKFPFHISQVAMAYHERDRKDDRATPTLVRPSSRLAIPFDETGNPRDVVPALSPAMTTATDEFVTAKILETISVEDFRYIGILATDTRDMIFLSAMIRQYCPDVQIFIPSGDLLLGHPRYVNDLSGTIVASTYPLFSMAQRWDPPYRGYQQNHRRHLFSHEGDQGIYNAALSLLNEGGGPFADHNPRYFEALYDYGMPFDELENYRRLDDVARFLARPQQDPATQNSRSWAISTRYEQPSVWVSVVGQRGLWPVAYRDPKAISGAPQLANYTFQSRNAAEAIGPELFAKQFLPLIPQFTWQWGVVFLGLSVAAWLTFWFHVPIAAAPPGAHIASRWLGVLAPPDTGRIWLDDERRWRFRDHLHREGFVMCGLLGLAATYAYVGLRPCWIAFADSPCAEFLRPELHTLATQNDRWNIRFAWMAYYGSYATVLALMAALACRASLWLPSEVGKHRLRRAFQCAFGAAVPIACLEMAIAIMPDVFGPWAARMLRGYALLPDALRGSRVGEGMAALNLAVLASAVVVSGVLLAVGWRLKQLSLWGGTALIGLLALPPSLSVTLVSREQWVYVPERFHTLLFFERAVNLGSGVSPFVPAIILALIGIFWPWSQLRRITFAERFWGPPLALRTDPVTADSLAKFQVRLADLARGVAAWLAGVARRSAGVLARLTRRVAARWMKRSADEGKAEKETAVGTEIGAQTVALSVQVMGIRASGTKDAGPPRPDPLPHNEGGPGQASGSWVLYKPQRRGQRTMAQRLRRAHVGADRLVRGWLPPRLMLWPPMLAAEVAAVVVLFRLWQRSVPSVDFPGGWTILAMTIFWFLMFSVVVSLGRFIALWRAIAMMTREFLALPMIRAYDRIPPIYTRSFGRYLDQIIPSMENLELPVRQWAVVASGFSKVEADLRARFVAQPSDESGSAVQPLDFDRAARAITRGNPEATGAEPSGSAAANVISIYLEEIKRLGEKNPRAGGAEMVGMPSGALADDDVAWSVTWAALRNASRACFDVIDPLWIERAATEGYGDAKEPRPADGPAREVRDRAMWVVGPDTAPTAGTEKALKEWVQAAEDLIALELIAFVSQNTVHLKSLAYYLAVAPVLLLLVVGSYPFQPQRFLQVCIWAILFLVVAGVVWVYVRMEKNEFLSRISRTAPNQVTLDRTFLGNLLAFVIPVVGLVLAQFPFVSDMLNQVVEPITRVLK